MIRLPQPARPRVARALLALSIAALFGAAPAGAQAALDVHVAGGLAHPTDDLGSLVRSGATIEAAVTGTVPFTAAGLRGDLLYASFPAPAGSTLSGTSVFGFAASFVLTLPVPGARPYLLAGPGFYRVHFAHRNRASDGDTPTRGGFHVGAGASVPVGRLRAFAEARYHYISVKGLRTTFVPVVVGVSVPLRAGRRPVRW